MLKINLKIFNNYFIFQIGWRKCSRQPNNNIYNKLPYSSTCSCNLILCQDYNSKDEFYNCIKICIENSNDFSESGYRRITQTIETIDSPNISNIETPLIIIHDDSINQEPIEIIDLTADDEVENEKEQAADPVITININEEIRARNTNTTKTTRGHKKKRSRRQVANNSEQNVTTNHHFVEVTADEILGNKKKPNNTRTPIVTRSKSNNSLRGGRSN